ncbi:hypothetical protein RAJCM14343_5302 [Rhodococcus aetherivorans]|uniref:Uncharacterized protein n=1 Tax=Rhodococcus aetherivorans TaxID=191292 RepID=A0ABQ0YTU0_9NOCA|nr:hypothetical protein RAJCM14343_5302 [Rhodococcus aetherivorans]
MYGSWRSWEHFSVAGSAPMYTSVDVHVLAEAARAAVGPGRGPAPVHRRVDVIVGIFLRK